MRQLRKLLSIGAVLALLIISIPPAYGANSAHGETVDLKIAEMVLTPQGGSAQNIISSPTDGPVTITADPKDKLFIKITIKITSTDSIWDNINPFSNNFPDVGQCVAWNVVTPFENWDFYYSSTHTVSEFLGSWDGVYDNQIIADVSCAFGAYSSSGEHIYDQSTIYIKAKPAPPTISLNLTANPTTINPGQSSTISWTSSGATSCVGSRGGSYPTSGSFSASPTSTTSYGMTCTGPGGNVTKNVTVTVTGTTGGAQDTAPVGYHDAVDNTACSTSGWAYDADTPTQSIIVNLYQDGNSGSGTFLGGYTANTLRPDIVGASGGVSPGAGPNHGFNITLPSSLKDGRSHSLYAYGINTASSGSNTLLTNSPKTIQCAAVSQPPSQSCYPAADIKVQ